MISISLLTLSTCFSVLSTLSIRILSILTIGVLHSGLIIPISLLLLVLMPALSLQIKFFAFQMAFFLNSQTWCTGQRNSYKQIFLLKCGGEVWREGQCHIVLWLVLSLSVSRCFWTVNFTNISKYFFSLLYMEQMASGLDSEFPFLQVILADNISVG